MVPRSLIAVLLLAGCAAAPALSPPALSPPALPASTSAVLALDVDGFRILQPSGSTQPLAFGTPSDVALETITRLQGAPMDQGTNEQCGVGPLGFSAWRDGLIVWTQDGAFAGWALSGWASNGAKSDLTTMAGIGVGSTRAELDAAVVADVYESTLGMEFAAGGLIGILSGPGPRDTITNLWAGVFCIFR